MRKSKVIRLLILSCGITSLILSYGMGRLIPYFWMWQLLMVFKKISLLIALLLFLILIMQFLFSHRIYKGFRYFWHHWYIINRLEKQMVDANFGLKRMYWMEIPKVKLMFSKGFKSAELRISNAIKFDRKLEDIVMSSALGKYIVERHYLTNDENYYVYELVDASVSFKMNFSSKKEFYRYSTLLDDYRLFLDERSDVKLQHCLLVGITGSGKTYALYSLILQMLSKEMSYELYFADPKGSSLAVIGELVEPERSAIDFDDIINNLQEFVSLLRERKEKIKTLLKTKLDADYSNFNLSPYIFIFDEYASFVSVLASKEKKVRDEVKKLLYEVILQGRQLGFFLILVMQKSDANLIETAIRDNMPLKIVLGNSEQQTYVTAFGTGVNIPNRHYAVGEGVFTEPVLAPEPKLVQFSMLNFDVLEAFKTIKLG